MATYDLAEFNVGTTGVTYDVAELNFVAGGVTYDLAGFDMEAGSSFAVTLGPNPPRFDPFAIAALTASSVIVPDSWVFQQIDGFGGAVVTPTVALTGTGGIRSYQCPGRLATQELFFRVTATKGSTVSVAEVKHTIAPHAGIFGPGGVGWQYHPTP